MQLPKIIIHSLIISFSFFGVSVSALALEPREMPSFEEWLKTQPDTPDDYGYDNDYDNAEASVLAAEAALADIAASMTPEDVLYQTKTLAEQNDADAQLSLGIMYRDGEHVPQDYHQAFIWFQKSANQGNSLAQGLLGLMYYQGKGVRQNYTLAKKWVLKSANQGDAGSQGFLGEMYEYGKGVRQDKVQAKEWYGKSCDNGSQDGCDEYKILNQK